MSVKGKCAIVGLGVTAMGKVYGRSASDFAAEAIKLALDDAGLQKEEVDGLLINANLPGDMLHGGGGNLAGIPRKAAQELKELK